MPDKPQAFAVWLTGLPASGKSTLAATLSAELHRRGIRPAVLESDALRPILTPHAQYSASERDTFYTQLAAIGILLTRQGIPVIFDATANLRRYRDAARRAIPAFFEVYVDCPLPVCQARDPKGIYRAAANVPGLQAPYEPPLAPERTVRHGDPDAAARILALLPLGDAPCSEKPSPASPRS